MRQVNITIPFPSFSVSAVWANEGQCVCLYTRAWTHTHGGALKTSFFFFFVMCQVTGNSFPHNWKCESQLGQSQAETKGKLQVQAALALEPSPAPTLHESGPWAQKLQLSQLCVPVLHWTLMPQCLPSMAFPKEVISAVWRPESWDCGTDLFVPGRLCHTLSQFTTI